MNTIPYKTKQQIVEIHPNLFFNIQSLLNQQQYYDPNHKAKRLGICSAAWPIFGMLWPSSIQLALKIIKRPIPTRSNMLEIGCGLGIASLVAQQMGLNITASDRHPLAGKFLTINSQLNNLPSIRFRHGQWGDVPKPNLNDTNAPLLSGKYNHIIGSDVLYEPCSAKQVADFIQKFSEYDCTIWIVDPNRGYRNHLTRELKTHGFTLEECTRLTEPINNLPYKGHLLVYKRGNPPTT